MPLRPVEDPVDRLAGVGHLLLDAHLVGVEVHEAAFEAEAAGAQEALVDPGRAEHVGAEIADERHGREPEHAAGYEHRDAGRVRQRGGDEQAVRDDDQLALLPQLERDVVGGRARVERHRLALLDHRRGGAGDRALMLDLEPQAQLEPDFRLALLERPHPAADPRDEPLLGEGGQVAADRYLRNRKRLRKFRNLNGVARLEHPEHLLHPLFLGKRWVVGRPVDVCDLTTAAGRKSRAFETEGIES